MKYNAEIFIPQFSLAKRFVYHLVYYRRLHKAYQTSGLKSEFWAHTIDAHLLQGAIHWCMVFGSDGCQPTHWKKLSPDEKNKLVLSFRKGLFKKTDLTPSAWESYWNLMNNFRNQYAAHREIGFNMPVPDFSIALDVTFFYDDWIREVIFPDYFEEPPLNVTWAELALKFNPLSIWLIEKEKRLDYI